MSWVGIMDGKVVSTFWFVEDGANVSVNQERYLDMLRNDVYPKMVAKFGRNLANYWFQQVSSPGIWKILTSKMTLQPRKPYIQTNLTSEIMVAVARWIYPDF